MAANGNANKKETRIDQILSKIPDKLPVPSESTDWILLKLAGMKPTDVLTAEKRKTLINCVISSTGAFIALIVSSIVIYIASTDDKALTEGFFKYAVFIVVPIVIGAALVLPIFTQKFNVKTLAMNGFIACVFFFALYQYQQNKTPESVIFVRYAVYGLTVFAIIVALAIAYRVYYRYIHNTQGWIGVINQISFYLPCLLIEFIEYIKSEIGITPNTVLVLLGIEVLVFGLVFALPELYKVVSRAATSKPTSHVILAEPVFLNTETKLTDYKLLSLDVTGETDPFSPDYKYRRQYTVSFWCYLNNNHSSRNYHPVLRLGRSDEVGGKPLITYSNMNGKYRIYLTNQSDQHQYEVQLPTQKWNYFVITYDGNRVDLFTNGNLVKTFKLNDGSITRPDYSVADTITAGINPDSANLPSMYQTSPPVGASGAICNVAYHTRPLTQREIITEYNQYMYQNPPTPTP